MPEYVEALSSCLLAQHWFNSVKNSSPLLLKAMYADATLDEQRKSNDPLVKMGLPYPLAPDSKVKRGPRLAQNPIYPPISCSVQDAAFQLKDVVFNPRSVLLLLESSSSDPAVAGMWWMQVQLLTHTIAQVYTLSQWRDSISKIDKDIRGFKVGMALDFGDYVLSFLTIDLVFRVFYSRSRDELPAPLYDIYLHFEKSLQVMIKWARARRTGKKKCSGSAIETIRKNTNIFVGIGVYTASEVFHHAGLLPILTESELFDSPSRFARFVSSFYSHAA
ncbi:hypothetical protein EYR38_010482 [Pleurotus pulmonarius]|nr:hypothetical protein EYR38_010482 [Pleurotus pulmonarius]